MKVVIYAHPKEYEWEFGGANLIGKEIFNDDTTNLLNLSPGHHFKLNTEKYIVLQTVHDLNRNSLEITAQSVWSGNPNLRLSTNWGNYANPRNDLHGNYWDSKSNLGLKYSIFTCSECWIGPLSVHESKVLKNPLMDDTDNDYDGTYCPVCNKLWYTRKDGHIERKD